MISGLEWLLLIALSTAFVLMAMLVAARLEGQRLVDVRALSEMGAQPGMRYRVLAQGRCAWTLSLARATTAHGFSGAGP